MSANKSFGPAAEGEGGVKTANVSLLRLPLVSVVDDGDGGAIIDAKGSLVAATEFFGESEQIVRAVNCHDQLVAALEDLLSGWRYIRETHGDLYGVGWDRAEEKAAAALAAAKVPQ